MSHRECPTNVIKYIVLHMSYNSLSNKRLTCYHPEIVIKRLSFVCPKEFSHTILIIINLINTT